MKTANLIVYVYAGQLDEWRDEWAAVLPHEVPEWVKEPEVVADLVAGYIVDRDGAYYRGIDVGPSPILLPREKRFELPEIEIGHG